MAIATRTERERPAAEVDPPRPQLSRRTRLRRFYRRHERVVVFPISLVLLVLLWELAAEREWIEVSFFSRPSDIFDAFVSMYIDERDIYTHLDATLRTATTGFALAVVIGIAVGTVTGSVRRLAVLTDPYIMALNALPTVALLPLLILWLGIGEETKVFLVVLGSLFNVLINTQVGVANADQQLIDVAKTFQANRAQIFAKVMMPSAMPYIVAGIRLAVGRALIMTFVAELFMANRGLGYIISDAGARFQAARLFVGVFTLAFIGIVGTQVIAAVERWKFSYGRSV